MSIDEMDLLLTDHARRWLEDQPTPPPVDEALRRARARRSPTISRLAVAACILVVVVIAITVVAIATRPAHHAATARDSLTTTTFPDGVVLTHPASWKYVGNRPGDALRPQSVGGFLINQSVLGGCVTSAGSTQAQCQGATLSALSPGGILVSVAQASDAAGNPPLGSGQTQTISGYPAEVTTTRHPHSCPLRTDEAIWAEVRPPPRTTFTQTPGPYVIQACLAGPHLGQAEHQVRAMLDTAVIYLLSGGPLKAPDTRLTAAELALADRVAHGQADAQQGVADPTTGWPDNTTNASVIATTPDGAKKFAFVKPGWPAHVLVIRLLGRFPHTAIAPAPGGSSVVRAATFVIDPATGKILETSVLSGRPAPLPDSVYLFAR